MCTIHTVSYTFLMVLLEIITLFKYQEDINFHLW